MRPLSVSGMWSLQTRDAAFILPMFAAPTRTGHRACYVTYMNDSGTSNLIDHD
jgi:hypothetical protein